MHCNFSLLGVVFFPLSQMSAFYMRTLFAIPFGFVYLCWWCSCFLYFLSGLQLLRIECLIKCKTEPLENTGRREEAREHIILYTETALHKAKNGRSSTYKLNGSRSLSGITTKSANARNEIMKILLREEKNVYYNPKQYRWAIIKKYCEGDRWLRWWNIIRQTRQYSESASTPRLCLVHCSWLAYSFCQLSLLKL